MGEAEETTEAVTTEEASTEAPTTKAEETTEAEETTVAVETEAPVECKKYSCLDPSSQCTVVDNEITCPCKEPYEKDANDVCICNTRLRPMQFLCDTGNDVADEAYFEDAVTEASSQTLKSSLLSVFPAL